LHAEDIEILKERGVRVEELPTGYILTLVNEIGQDIILKKEHCEIIQKIVIDGRQLRIVVLTPAIGMG
jgi:hypothetical protein